MVCGGGEQGGGGGCLHIFTLSVINIKYMYSIIITTIIIICGVMFVSCIQT